MNCNLVDTTQFWPNEDQRNTLIMILALLLGLSILCLVLALHNIYYYLIKDERWRVLLLSMFYGSLVLMLVFQIWDASLVINFYGVVPDCDVLFAEIELDTC